MNSISSYAKENPCQIQSKKREENINSGWTQNLWWRMIRNKSGRQMIVDKSLFIQTISDRLELRIVSPLRNQFGMAKSSQKSNRNVHNITNTHQFIKCKEEKKIMSICG